ncbi:hypothetical protein KGM_201978 [Danaus plexippus plexippus]|uniref:Uncharacterized protein n=1 Tax=Danaus plexippus plexippus TaxID=278856 RepID=A0A212FL52_DANPL|nr:hypothetical protein KGM_201978 [Danaus plexippus plexippus]
MIEKKYIIHIFFLVLLVSGTFATDSATNVNSANKAKAVNSNHETIVVENKITPQCNGLFDIAARFFTACK